MGVRAGASTIAWAISARSKESLDRLSELTIEKSIEADRGVPPRLKIDLAAHGAKLNPSPAGRRRRKLGDRLTVASDDHLLALFHSAEQLVKAIFGFGDADFHDTRTMAIFPGCVNSGRSSRITDGNAVAV